MLRQSSSRNHRSKKLRPRHSLQVFLLFAVGVWVVYQLTRSYGKRRAVVVATDDNSGEPARRRLGRKGLVDFNGVASEDDIVGAGVRSDVGSEGVERGGASSDDPLSKDGDREGDDGDEEEQEGDEDDGVEDVDDSLAADEEEDGRDFQSRNGNSEGELMKTMNGETDGASELGNGLHQPSELKLNSSVAPRANATGRLQDGATVPQLNATDGASAADGAALSLGDSALKNTSSVDVSLHNREITGNVPKKSLVNDFAVRAPGAENEN